ncbi:MBL fold metallo-hydrolase [Thermosipho atlanticus]|uniref:RNAse Z n=1 Tax=Thermosipho atlanticus DSM 15807 TaxID=1123380 RepID=A0A1M5R1U5_9BACT|nr:MBL fold metallo-hydrolase [Thermosipho atlanticus]SHH19959.1 RNAse Z [Thermosipho atlanticus DSM 15807]
MNIIGYSKALYTTWVYYSPERILFDAGEGVSTMMNNKIYAIKHIFLTHGHVDHISGLWSLINTRNNAMGDRGKDLSIYYPKGNKGIEEYLTFIRKVNSDLRFNLNIYPIEDGSEIILRDSKQNKKFIRAFKVKHTQNEKSFGYHVFEERKKLKKEFQNLSQNEIAELAKLYGSDYITEKYNSKILTFSGDTYLLKKKDIEDTEILFHECTFLNKNDRKYNNHATIEDIVELVKDTKIKKLILYHISGRYLRKVESIISRYRYELENIELYYIKPDKLFKL